MGSLPLAIDTVSRSVGTMTRHPRLVGITAAGVAVLVGLVSVLHAIVPPTQSVWLAAVCVLSVTTLAALFEGAVVVGTLRALRGERVSVFGSVAQAGERIGSFASYAVVLTAVILVFACIARDPGHAESLAFRLAAWTLALTTWLAIPVIVSEGGSGVAAIRKSARLASRRMLAIWCCEMARRVLGAGLILIVMTLGNLGLPPAALVVVLVAGGLTLATWGTVMTAVMYEALQDAGHRDGPGDVEPPARG